MANPLKRILRSGQAQAAPAAAPEPAPAEASSAGEDGATGGAATRDAEPATTATEPVPAEAPAPGEPGHAGANGATGADAAERGGEPATTATVPVPAAAEAATSGKHLATRDAAPEQTADEAPAPAWRLRGRARRRLRHLNAARELALRDLGGLVFDLHRFGRERPDLLAAKLDALAELDRERRALQEALDDPAGFDVLRRPGLASCPRCGTLVASEARFCSSCGVSLATATAHAATATAARETEPEHVPGAAAATSDLPGT